MWLVLFYLQEGNVQNGLNLFLRCGMINSHCKYYPCLEGLEDCTFCYCPLYPCGKKYRGGKWIKDSNKKEIWDCSNCTIIHREDVVKRLLRRMIKL